MPRVGATPEWVYPRVCGGTGMPRVGATPCGCPPFPIVSQVGQGDNSVCRRVRLGLYRPAIAGSMTVMLWCGRKMMSLEGEYS